MPKRTKQTKRDKARTARLMPGGVPRYVRCYDNSGETADNFTVIFTGNHGIGESPVLSMSSNPFWPQGICQHDSSRFPSDTLDVKRGTFTARPPAIGRRCHLGKRVRFEDLPDDCKLAVLRDYREIWDIADASAERAILRRQGRKHA